MIKTVSLELAKKMKELGFTQESHFGWYDPFFDWKISDAWKNFEGSIAAPTAEEVLEQLPEHITVDEMWGRLNIHPYTFKGKKVCFAAYTDPFKGTIVNRSEDTYAEAAGSLWVYLKEQKL